MSVNDITGDRLVTKIPSEKFKNGWDAIFGKPQSSDEVWAQKQVENKACGCLNSCGGTKEEWDEDCFGWNNCSYCDNGYYPCNQNCMVFG